MNRKITRIVLPLALAILLLGGGIAYYLFNMSHRDVAGSEVDLEISATELVNTFLEDVPAANKRFLSTDGDSKILAIRGRVKSIETDFAGAPLLLLFGSAGKSDVLVQLQAGHAIRSLHIGNEVVIKGAITSGAGYDADLDLYTPVTIAQAVLIGNQ